MADLLFYHLERDPLDAVLPPLLERSLARGWRCFVRAGSPERVTALDQVLWTWRDDSFLPHATTESAAAARQPILIGVGGPIANEAAVLFSVDGANVRDAADFERAVYLFDGHDPDAVAAARDVWRWAKAEMGADGAPALALTYWQQNPEGAWQKRG